jgi:hypothetical protein
MRRKRRIKYEIDRNENPYRPARKGLVDLWVRPIAIGVIIIMAGHILLALIG